MISTADLATPAPSLDGFAQRVNELAPLPALALRVLQLVEDENASAADLASVIAADPAITARLLRLANSAYYSAGRRIATVRDAVVLLGLGEIRQLVLTTSLMEGFSRSRSGAISMPTFWGHSIAVGMVAEVIARQTRLGPPEEAFTAGILHDIGKLVMDHYGAGLYGRVTTVAAAEQIPLIKAEAAVFGFTHAQLGARLAELWRLPTSMCDAIGRHHETNAEDDGLAFIVACANDLCRDHGLWCGFEDVEPGATLPETPGDDPVRSAALAKLGGIEKIGERINSFLQATPGSGKPAAPSRLPGKTAPASTLRRAPWVVADRWPGRGGQFEPRPGR